MGVLEQSQSQEEGRGVLILVLGILGVAVLGPILGIPAWIMGRNDLKKIQEGKIPSSERALTKAGMILGIISTVLGLIVFALVLFIIMWNISVIR
jgi:hypothetical protein